MRMVRLSMPRCKRGIGILAGMALAWGLCVAAGAANPAGRASVPADGRITITDYGYRDWGPELVQYTVDTDRFDPDRVVLIDSQGGRVPCQIDGSTLSFVASVPKASSTTYTLRAVTLIPRCGLHLAPASRMMCSSSAMNTSPCECPPRRPSRLPIRSMHRRPCHRSSPGREATGPGWVRLASSRPARLPDRRSDACVRGPPWWNTKRGTSSPQGPVGLASAALAGDAVGCCHRGVRLHPDD